MVRRVVGLGGMEYVEVEVLFERTRRICPYIREWPLHNITGLGKDDEIQSTDSELYMNADRTLDFYGTVLYAPGLGQKR